MSAIVYPDVHEFMRKHGNYLHNDNIPIVVTSGGFDPMHIGHLRCIQETNKIAHNLTMPGDPRTKGASVIIVNGDGFLERKKGKPFMSHAERMEIISGIEGVDFVVGWDDGSQTVTGCLEILIPTVFTKGGDRSDSAKVPEFVFCDSIGCKVIFGVGGTAKVQSSSDLISGSEPQKSPIASFHKNKSNSVKKERITDFDWGYEEEIANNKFYDAKILSILPNNAMPLQSHAQKDKTVYMIKGIASLSMLEDTKSEVVFLEIGDFKRIKAGTVYRLSSWSGPSKIFEVSTHNPDDVIIIKK